MELDAGPHHLVLRAGPRPEPIAVAVTHQPLEADAFQPCNTSVCAGVVRIAATVPPDGRTVSFVGQVSTGVDGVHLIGSQEYPNITYSMQLEEAYQRNRPVRVEVPLDPGSGIATLDVAHIRKGLPGLEFELLEVEVSPLPHGLTVILAQERQTTTPSRGTLALTGDERGWAAAAYAGEPGERLVRLDERFDPRWVLHVNDKEVRADRHVVLDGHFNGWLVDLSPGDKLAVTFIPNIGYFWILMANLVFLIGMLVVGWMPVPRPWR